MWVLKIGGRELDQPRFVDKLATFLSGPRPPLVVVHGGGKGTSELSARLGLETRFVEGLRVTDAATLECAVMGLAGLAKRQIVQPLVARGLPALGLTGMDGGLVRCRKLAKPDLGWVGEPVEVNAPALRALATSGWIVCLSPLCIDERGDLYNVNADPVATAVATGLGAERLIFVTDVGGVLDQGKVMEHLDSADFVRLTESGAIGSGMTPKLKACFEALKGGVNEVTITDLDGLISAHGGTRVSL